LKEITEGGLKGSGIFINEDLIPEDQVELRKEVLFV
jgi:hypothetical protein